MIPRILTIIYGEVAGWGRYNLPRSIQSSMIAITVSYGITINGYSLWQIPSKSRWITQLTISQLTRDVNCHCISIFPIENTLQCCNVVKPRIYRFKICETKNIPLQNHHMFFCGCVNHAQMLHFRLWLSHQLCPSYAKIFSDGTASAARHRIRPGRLVGSFLDFMGNLWTIYGIS